MWVMMPGPSRSAMVSVSPGKMCALSSFQSGYLEFEDER